jgi:hypothetical protein
MSSCCGLITACSARRRQSNSAAATWARLTFFEEHDPGRLECVLYDEEIALAYSGAGFILPRLGPSNGCDAEPGSLRQLLCGPAKAYSCHAYLISVNHHGRLIGDRFDINELNVSFCNLIQIISICVDIYRRRA